MIASQKVEISEYIISIKKTLLKVYVYDQS